MKRLIAAVSFAVLVTPALAQNGKPFEQVDLDRALPNVTEQSVGSIDYRFGGSAPYEQITVDRALPELRTERAQVASFGETRSDVEISAAEEVNAPADSGLASGVWAHDHNFIAPAL